jgi:hypothetical protein
VLTIEQAHWLIDFMRNLPGSKSGEVSDRDYERSWHAQRAEAHRLQNAYSTFPDEQAGYDGGVTARGSYGDDQGSYFQDE